jgi:hypothetical protein
MFDPDNDDDDNDEKTRHSSDFCEYCKMYYAARSSALQNGDLSTND